MRARNTTTVFCLRVFAFTATALAVSAQPYGYVSNEMGDNISVVNMATNSISAEIPLSTPLNGLAVTPNGAYLYVAEQSLNSVAVVSTATNSVVATIPVGSAPVQIAITPNGQAAYVVNQQSDNVSVINTATNTVVDTITEARGPGDCAGRHVCPGGQSPFVDHFRD